MFSFLLKDTMGAFDGHHWVEVLTTGWHRPLCLTNLPCIPELSLFAVSLNSTQLYSTCQGRSLRWRLLFDMFSVLVAAENLNQHLRFFQRAL